MGKRWSEQTLRLTQEAIETDFVPLSDLRASAAYRMEVAGNLLRRFYLEHCAEPLHARTADAAMP